MCRRFAASQHTVLSVGRRGGAGASNRGRRARPPHARGGRAGAPRRSRRLNSRPSTDARDRSRHMCTMRTGSRSFSSLANTDPSHRTTTFLRWCARRFSQPKTSVSSPITGWTMPRSPGCSSGSECGRSSPTCWAGAQSTKPVRPQSSLREDRRLPSSSYEVISSKG